MLPASFLGFGPFACGATLPAGLLGCVSRCASCPAVRRQDAAICLRHEPAARQARRRRARMQLSGRRRQRVGIGQTGTHAHTHQNARTAHAGPALGLPGWQRQCLRRKGFTLPLRPTAPTLAFMLAWCGGEGLQACRGGSMLWATTSRLAAIWVCWQASASSWREHGSRSCEKPSARMTPGAAALANTTVRNVAADDRKRLNFVVNGTTPTGRHCVVMPRLLPSHPHWPATRVGATPKRMCVLAVEVGGRCVYQRRRLGTALVGVPLRRGPQHTGQHCFGLLTLGWHPACGLC